MNKIKDFQSLKLANEVQIRRIIFVQSFTYLHIIILVYVSDHVERTNYINFSSLSIISPTFQFIIIDYVIKGYKVHYPVPRSIRIHDITCKRF